MAVGPRLVKSPATAARPPGPQERRDRRINGILRLGSSASQRSPNPTTPTTPYPSVGAGHRLRISTLLACVVLLVTHTGSVEAQSAVAVVVEPAGLNLRGGPGTTYQALALIPKGTELPILGATVNSRWLPVSYQGTAGFVLDDYVEIQPRSPAGPLATPSPAPPSSSQSAPSAGGQLSQRRVTSPDGLNLRAGPAVDQRVLTLMPEQAFVSVIGLSLDGRWANVVYLDQSGWADLQYLSPVEEPRPATENQGTGGYVWPVTGRSITTPFGPSHLGIDIDQYPAGGNPVGAVAAGTVSFAGGTTCCSYGLYVDVQHPNGTMTRYAHLDAITVTDGQAVTQGQTLGRSGNTGRSTGAHLHLELYVNSAPVDPLGVLPRT